MWVRIPPPALGRPGWGYGPGPMKVHDLPTPALLVDIDAFDRNVATMRAAWPGEQLRPHVKAFKSTALAARLVEAGHRSLCCATVREVAGLAAAGLGHDILLANESLDLSRLTPIVRSGMARISVAVDSVETIDAAVRARHRRGAHRRRRRHAALWLRACRRTGKLAELAPRSRPVGPWRDGLRGPPDARTSRAEGGQGRSLDGAARSRQGPRSAATSSPAAAPALGTSTPG